MNLFDEEPPAAVEEEVSEAERQAIVADMLRQQLEAEGDTVMTTGAPRPESCECERPLPIRDELGDLRCHWCGRAPS
jgi:hypothetical protein